MNVVDKMFKEVNDSLTKASLPSLSKTDYKAVKEPLFRLICSDPNVNIGDVNKAINKLIPNCQIQKLEDKKGSIIKRTDINPLLHPVKRHDKNTDTVKTQYLPNQDILGIMKDRYAIINNAELNNPIAKQIMESMPKETLKAGTVELIEKTSENGSMARWSYHFNGLARDIKQLTGSKTQLNFLVSVINSFGGQSRAKLSSGAIDLFCINLCTSAELSSEAYGHTLNFNPKKLEEFMKREIKLFEDRIALWQMWANKKITHAQAEHFMRVSFARDNIVKTKKELIAGGMDKKVAEREALANATSKKMSKMMKQLEVEFENRGRSVWAVYSALTNYSSHTTRFEPRNSANSDNVESTLIRRESEVNNLVSSLQFKELELA